MRSAHFSVRNPQIKSLPQARTRSTRFLETDVADLSPLSADTSAPFVAFLDSGTGGIPYMLHLQKKCPDVRCVYLGDTANFPYGEKSCEQITDCAAAASRLLIDRFNPDAIVVACNTISVTALSALRELFPSVPFVGTVPAIKLAAAVSPKKRIGLLATRQTVENAYTDRLVAEFASDCYIARRGDPELIDFVEKKLFTATKEERAAAVAPAIEFFRQHDVDTIILGCTHFIHMADDIQKAAGSFVRVVDSRDGVVNQTMRVLEYAKSAKAKKNTCSVENMTFYITGVRDAVAENEYRTLARNLNIPYGGKLIDA
ncbi:MAG: glutamate racemase [Spirochaetaceae bacterium]|nr:glutamate racemase [Spirochaetaceae bacterium]